MLVSIVYVVLFYQQLNFHKKMQPAVPQLDCR